MRDRAVAICHQTVADGDAIGNDIAGMYDLLASMSFDPAIACEYLRGDFGGRRVITDLTPQAINTYGLVIYHHRTYWELGEALLQGYSEVPARAALPQHHPRVLR